MGNCLTDSHKQTPVSNQLASFFRSNTNDHTSQQTGHSNLNNSSNKRDDIFRMNQIPEISSSHPNDVQFRSQKNQISSYPHSQNSHNVSRMINSKNKSFLGANHSHNSLSGGMLQNNNNMSIKEQATMICLNDFISQHENELSVRKGDTVKVFDCNDPDWWLAEHATTKKQGYIPKNYVASQMIEMEEWFFSKISRREAEKLLLADYIPRGTYIVRNTEDNTGYSLSILHDKDESTPVKHYKIRTKDNGGFFISPKNVFNTVAELVAFYCSGANGLCCRLHKPCPKPKPSFWPDRSDEIQRSELHLKSKIGTGYFGEVYFGTYRNIPVAVKTLKQGTMSPQAFLEEATIMRKCRHQKLVPLYGVCSQGEPLLIITEYMCNGSLLDYLRNNRDSKDLKLPDLMDIAAQIAEGMAYLEKIKLVHRDLAARNILVGESNIVKVADFGLARVLEDTYVAKHGSKFPVKWCALESALYGRFSIKSDVWSYGIVLFELVTYGQIPYAGMQNKEVVDAIQKGYRMPKPANCDCPDSVYVKMLECWNAVPEKRPTFEYLTTFFSYFNISSEQSYRDALECI